MCRTMTQERALKRLRYDSDTGQLIWATAWRNKRHIIGQPAGTIERNGYWHVKIDGVSYASHRLIWLMVHGKWPDKMIDHIDGVRTNNRLSNLRDVDSKTNNMNRHHVRKDSRSGAIGVYGRNGRWFAYAQAFGSRVSLGGFGSKEAASAARAAFKNSHNEVPHV